MLSSWIELHYAAVQVLPGSDGIRDELDGITRWSIDARQCFEDASSKLVGRAEVAVFRPGTDPCRGPAALTAAAALGGDDGASGLGAGIARAVDVLLLPDGRLRDDLGGDDVQHVVVLLNDVPAAEVAREGMALRAVGAIVDRLAPGRTLVASVPARFTDDDRAPAFLDGVPGAVRDAWLARGLRHAGRGVWVLPAP